MGEKGLPEEEFSALLQTVKTALPLLKQEGGRGEENDAATSPAARRERLLTALKPYLSPARREAVDYLIRMGRVGDTLRALR